MADRRRGSIVRRTLEQESRSLLGWALGLVAYSAVMIAIYPTVHGNAGFALPELPQAGARRGAMRLAVAFTPPRRCA